MYYSKTEHLWHGGNTEDSYREGDHFSYAFIASTSLVSIVKDITKCTKYGE